MSNDVAGAKSFYGNLFGWTPLDTSFEPIGAYTVFKRGNVQEGGVLGLRLRQDGFPRETLWEGRAQREAWERANPRKR